MERTLKIETIKVERKMFVLALMENERGQFLRITEEATDRRAKIIIPAAGMEEFRKTLEMLSQLCPGSPGSGEHCGAPQCPPADGSPLP